MTLVGNSSLAYPGGSYQVNASGMSSSMTWSFVPRAAAIAAAKNLQLSKGNPQRWSLIGQLRTGCSRSSFQDYTSNSARTGEHRTSHIITTSPSVAVTFGTPHHFALKSVSHAKINSSCAYPLPKGMKRPEEHDN